MPCHAMPILTFQAEAVSNGWDFWDIEWNEYTTKTEKDNILTKGYIRFGLPAERCAAIRTHNIALLAIGSIFQNGGTSHGI